MFRAYGIVDAYGRLGDSQESVRKAGLPHRRKPGVHQYIGGKARNEEHPGLCAGRKGQNLDHRKHSREKKVSPKR